MVHEEIDEKVEAQKKKDIIEFRNKKRTSRIFLFAVTIYEIVETILVVFLLFLLSTFIISKLFSPLIRIIDIAPTPKAVEIAAIVSSMVSVLSFFAIIFYHR